MKGTSIGGREKSLLLYEDPAFLGHETGDHPECPERLDVILGALRGSPLWPLIESRRPREATREELLRVHSAGLLSFLQDFSAAGGGRIDSDNTLSSGSWEAALKASGAAVQATEAVIWGPLSRAFCALRPPGHHARPGSLMGFCLMNSVAVAARHAREALGLDRVAILDIDVHHGNGSQEIFYEDPGVYFCSLHRYPFWPPGSGAREETGHGPGLGFNKNIPLPQDCSAETYLRVLEEALEKIAAYRPHLLLVSAGFDTYRLDPVAPGGLNLDEEHYPRVGALLRQGADQICQGRLVCLLEGGYNLKALPALTTGFLRGLMQF